MHEHSRTISRGFDAGGNSREFDPIRLAVGGEQRAEIGPESVVVFDAGRRSKRIGRARRNVPG